MREISLRPFKSTTAISCAVVSATYAVDPSGETTTPLGSKPSHSEPAGFSDSCCRSNTQSSPDHVAVTSTLFPSGVNAIADGRCPQATSQTTLPLSQRTSEIVPDV